MKKSLLALAAMGAFAGAAQAQSSVTVYGILDVGYTGGNARVTGPAGTTVKETVSRISNSMESGSRLGFRGNEDLGGGTSAQFTFELGIQPAGNAGSNATGTAPTTAPTTATASNAGSPNWTPNVRQAFVGLSQKGIGQVRIGTQNTLFWEQAGSNTTGQLAQTLGSMLAPSTDGAFFSQTGGITGAALGAYTVRTTNTINFRSERMAGVMAKASYTMSNSDQTQITAANGSYSGGNNNQNGYQVALDWNIAKANIQASYAAFTSEGPYTLPATNVTPVGWGSGLQGTNSKDNQTLITASYDFGFLKAYAGWTDRKITGVINSNNYLKRTAQEIGVRGYATKTIEYWGSVGNGRYTAQGVGSPTANITGYQLGSNYWMSKRTNLYAIFGANNVSSSSNGSAGINQYSVGVRHTF